MDTIETILQQHKTIADKTHFIYYTIMDFERGVYNRYVKTSKVCKVMGGLYLKYWDILSEMENVMCDKIPLSHYLRLSDYYCGRGRDRDENNTLTQQEEKLWTVTIHTKKGKLHIMTYDEILVVKKIILDVNNVLVYLKGLYYYKNIKSQVLRFETQFNKVIRILFEINHITLN
jgi:hypothetical protein